MSECDQKEVPAFWKEWEMSVQPSSQKHGVVKSKDQFSSAFRSSISEKKVDCPQNDREWCVDDQDGSYALINEDDYIFVNMEENEETYTAFEGGPIWRAIYEENCFLNNVASVEPSVEEFCSEANLLYHLVSGLHASVNTHISEGFENPRNSTELVTN